MGHSNNVFDTPYYTLREILPGFPKVTFYYEALRKRQTHLTRFFLTIGRLENKPSWKKDRRQPGDRTGQAAKSYSTIGNN